MLFYEVAGKNNWFPFWHLNTLIHWAFITANRTRSEFAGKMIGIAQTVTKDSGQLSNTVHQLRTP